MSRDEFELFDRVKPMSMQDITERLKHKKQCNVAVKRYKTKIETAVANARNLISSGRLVAECEVECISTMERLKEYAGKCQSFGQFAWDTETTGLDIFNDIIVGMSLYVPDEKAVYIPINHTDMDNNRYNTQLTEQQVASVIIPLLESGAKSITANGKFDGKVLNWNWKLNPFLVNWYWDIVIGGHLLNENEPHRLKALYFKYVKQGEGSDESFGELFGTDVPFNYTPIDVATIYGADDSYKTYKVFEFQKQFISIDHAKKDFRDLAVLFHETEMPLTDILIDTENRGVTIRPKFAKELADEMNGELTIVVSWLDNFASNFYDEITANKTLDRLISDDGKIGWGSVTQLQAFMYDVLDIIPRTYRRKEDRGTGVDNLNWIKEKTNSKYIVEFIDNLLKYRSLKKLLSSYVEKIPAVIEPKTNAVHSNFNQAGTVTGRFSSSHPITHLNLQNIPSHEKRIRKIFRARDGCLLIGGDYSQIEPRALSSVSQDDEMLRSYRNNEDLYANMASIIFDMPVEECVEFRPDGSRNISGAERRNQTKSVLLGIMYERTAGDIAGQFGKPASWGDMVVNTFIKKFPLVELCRMKYISMAETFGYVKTVDGRKRRLPDMTLSNHDDFRYKEAHKQVLNAVIQGSAGDVMKKAIVAVGHDERFKELGGHILMTIHDEMICEIPRENARKGADIMENLMKKVGQETLGVPMSVDIEASEYWYGENISI